MRACVVWSISLLFSLRHRSESQSASGVLSGSYIGLCTELPLSTIVWTLTLKLMPALQAQAQVIFIEIIAVHFS